MAKPAEEPEAQIERAKLELARECDIHVPEGFEELAAANQALSPRIGIDSPADAAYTAAQRAQALRKHKVIRGRWKPVGKGPCTPTILPTPRPTARASPSWRAASRTTPYDAKHDRLYAAVASGGVWMSKDLGVHWRSIGDRLPTQTVGAIAYTKARHGTLIAVTGDNAFGGDTYGGLGVFRSINGGNTWKRSRGVPQRRAWASRPPWTRPTQVDLRGHRRRPLPLNDAGRTLPQRRSAHRVCHGDSSTGTNCFFANIVTDVVVQSPDKFGHKGGAVLAAVGWRAGARENFNGKPESPGNGLYVSDAVAPGTFKGIDEHAAGFTPQATVGRVEMGVATGPEQDHDYVYAIVQDAELFNSGKLDGLDVPDIGIGARPRRRRPT